MRETAEVGGRLDEHGIPEVVGRRTVVVIVDTRREFAQRCPEPVQGGHAETLDGGIEIAGAETAGWARTGKRGVVVIKPDFRVVEFARHPGAVLEIGRGAFEYVLGIDRLSARRGEVRPEGADAVVHHMLARGFDSMSTLARVGHLAQSADLVGAGAPHPFAVAGIVILAFDVGGIAQRLETVATSVSRPGLGEGTEIAGETAAEECTEVSPGRQKIVDIPGFVAQ